MADARLRALERALLSDCTVEAEAAVLAERQRLGHLDRGRLVLAAYAGSEAAARVLGSSVPTLDVAGLETTQGLRAWTRMTHLAGRREALGCVAAAVEAGLEVYAATGRAEALFVAAHAPTLAEVRAHVEGDDRGARDRLRAAARLASPIDVEWWWVPDRCAHAMVWLARAVVEREHDPSALAASRALVEVWRAVGEDPVVDLVLGATLCRLALA
ncbi:MAG: hypothetical protein KF878_27405 [Planctomycetes bacterium]|nr:hypothetical protein [Planctomycetota bacterium]